MDQPQLDVLVLHEQQLEVLHEQQLEQLQDELVAAMSMAGSMVSTTSKVAASSSSSSRPSVLLIRCLSGQCRLDGYAAQPPPHPVLVLVEQQLDVLHEQQLEQLHDELHQPAASWPTSLMSAISNVAVSRASSSSLSAMVIHLLPGGIRPRAQPAGHCDKPVPRNSRTLVTVVTPARSGGVRSTAPARRPAARSRATTRS